MSENLTCVHCGTPIYGSSLGSVTIFTAYDNSRNVCKDNPDGPWHEDRITE